MAVQSLSRTGIASGFQKYDSALAGNAFDEGGSSDVLLSEQILTSAVSSVTFDVSTISPQFKHLQIRSVARSSRASTEDAMVIRFNNDSASNYSTHWMEGRGSSVTSSAQTNGTFIIFDVITAANSTANVYGSSIADILDAFSGNKNKTLRSLCGTSIPLIALQSGAWRSVSAITSLTITAANGNLIAGSRFSLYGVRG